MRTMRGLVRQTLRDCLLLRRAEVEFFLLRSLRYSTVIQRSGHRRQLSLSIAPGPGDERSHPRHVCRQARWARGNGLLRENVQPVARGAEPLPARDLAPPERRQVLSGRRRRASRPRAERPKAVLDAGTARKTSPSQLRAIELHLGGW